MRLDDNIQDSYRASMDIRERKVDPRYLTTPLHQLAQEFGWGWIKEQRLLFERNYKENCDAE